MCSLDELASQLTVCQCNTFREININRELLHHAPNTGICIVNNTVHVHVNACWILEILKYSDLKYVIEVDKIIKTTC